MEQRIEYLIDGWINKSLSEEERAELWQLLKAPEHDEGFKMAFDNYWFKSGVSHRMGIERADEIFSDITGARVVEMRKRRPWIKWVAAACIIAAIAVVGILTNNHPSSPVGIHANDVAAPTNTRAVITLADGSKVYLDSVGTGTLATQANTTVERSADGKIVYRPANGSAKEIVYNTLNNPRGSRVIDMQLSDGSHVWLNAGSSVTYPVAFVGNERKVEITGEAYFEVKHDASHPFIVSKGETNVTVLGTHFNVNAYDDEDALRVTLLEGSVRVESEVGGQKSEKTIKPGEQGKVMENGELRMENNVDLDEVMAWKNGMFSFESTDLQTIMKVLARWYDLDVVYEGKQANQQLHLEASRNTSLQNVLKVLELTSKMHFKIDGRKVIVTP